MVEPGDFALVVIGNKKSSLNLNGTARFGTDQRRWCHHAYHGDATWPKLSTSRREGSLCHVPTPLVSPCLPWRYLSPLFNIHPKPPKGSDARTRTKLPTPRPNPHILHKYSQTSRFTRDRSRNKRHRVSAVRRETCYVSQYKNPQHLAGRHISHVAIAADTPPSQQP